MAAAVLTPVLATIGTTEADRTSAVPANTEWAIDIRVANTTAAAIKIRVAISNGSTTKYICYDYSIAANDAVDIARGLALPAGWKIRDYAAATGVDIAITGKQRSTL